MLGKDHLEITFVFSVPLILYLILCVLSFELPIYIVVVFPICIIIGSLIPDADCNGEPTLSRKYNIVYLLMKPIYKSVVWITASLSKKYPKHIYSKVEEHRGILHSLVGVFFSSFILSILLAILLFISSYFVEVLNPQNIVYVFIFGVIGLLLGQILHLAEDSCTKSGIKWFLPFSKKLIRGNIATKSEKGSKRIDIRPRKFAQILGTTGAASSCLIILLWTFESEYFLYSLGIALFIQCFTFIFLYSIAQQKLEGSKWHRTLKEVKEEEKEKAKRRKKEMDNFLK